MQVILETSVIYALMDKGDKSHGMVKDFFLKKNGFYYIVPSTVIPELCYLINTRLGPYFEVKLLEEINKSFHLDILKDEDITRIIEILKKYDKLNIGYVDASIIAIAERLKVNKILTLDRKHFEVVAPRGFDCFDILI
jgi:predicted nucleic acid-binding protein